MRRLAAIALFLLPAQLSAHTDVDIVTPDEFWHAWSFEPVVLFLLALSAILYVLGWHNSRGASTSRTQNLCFISGWLALFISQVSPLHKLSSALFSAHMTQHELLMLIAAPLLVFSRPLATFVWALPAAWRPSLGSVAKMPAISATWAFISTPFVAWTLHAAA